MGIMMIYFMGFVNAFAKFGRYADLVLGLVFVGLGVHWHSPLTIGLGVFSVCAFVFDLNGFIQRRSLAFAHRRVAARRTR